MKKLLSIGLVGALLLCSCSSKESTTENFTTSTTPNVSNTEPEKSKTTTSSEEESTTTETTEHEPIHYLKKIEISDGILPDGEYLLLLMQADEDSQGGIFWVSGFWSLTEEELESFEAGDTVLLDDKAYIYSIPQYSDENYRGALHGEDEWDFSCIVKQGNGLFYLEDGPEGWHYWTYTISNEFHIALAPHADMHGDGIQYTSIGDFWQDILAVREYLRELGSEFAETDNVLIRTTIIDGKITEMFINPEEHEPWIPEEVYVKRYGERRY